MPELINSLSEQDDGFLRIVSRFWGVELDETSRSAMLKSLSQAMLDPLVLAEMVSALPEEARKALEMLQRQGGHATWSTFSRRFGTIREMGAARRDREAPFLAPVSAGEVLYYRGLIARAFLRAGEGEPQEVVYIPEDLLASLPAVTQAETDLLGKSASANLYAKAGLADDSILDHLCTFLAAIRAGVDPAVHLAGSGTPPLAVLERILEAAGILQKGTTDSEAVRQFLEAPRGNALSHLVSAWKGSQAVNELRLIPGLEFEGEWKNDPLPPRRFLLGALTPLPAGVWWDFDRFCADIRLKFPEFLRLGGEFDSWYIRQAGSPDFFRGMDHWEDVEGQLIRFFITGMLHWLGLVDLGFSTGNPTQPTAFRLSRWSSELLEGSAPADFPLEKEKMLIRRNGQLLIPRGVARSARYQAARFCEWVGISERGYEYAITPESLRRARKQGLRTGFLISLLRKYGGTPPQPSLVRALERWEDHETQAVLLPVTILQVSSPEILAELRASKAARYLGDTLGPVTVTIHPGAEEKVREALAELGYLCELKDGSREVV